MRKDITIAAEVRDTRGKNAARRLRVTGLVPAVLYGGAEEPASISVSPKELTRILGTKTGSNTIFNLQVAGKGSIPVMMVDWQNDPIKENMLHADLVRIDLTKRVTVNIPVVTHGEPKGVKLQGGLLEIITRELEIECLPDDIPEQFVIEVSELALNESIRASDIPMPGDAKLLTAPDSVLAHIVNVKEDETLATETAVAEPEVIKKGKKEAEPAAEPSKKK